MTMRQKQIFAATELLASLYREGADALHADERDTIKLERIIAGQTARNFAEASLQLIVAQTCLERLSEGLSRYPALCLDTALMLVRSALPPLLNRTYAAIAPCNPEVFLPPQLAMDYTGEKKGGPAETGPAKR